MTEAQKHIIEQNEKTYAAYDAIIEACEINDVTFNDFLDMMLTLNTIKIRNVSRETVLPAPTIDGFND